MVDRRIIQKFLPDVGEWSDYVIISRSLAVELYKRDQLKRFTADELDALRGKDLACWCNLDDPCHADELLKAVNPPEPVNEMDLIELD